MPQEADEPLSRTARLWLAFYLTWVALGVALVSTCASCAARQVPDDVPTLVEPPVAYLVKVVDGKVAGGCTVFKVGDGLVMTAGHCCGYADPMDDINTLMGLPLAKHAVSYHATGPYAVPGAALEVVFDDDDHDVCVMRGDMRGAPLTLAAHDPARGERVWTAGFPKGVYLISDGHWSGRNDSDQGVASVAVWGGASGSPMLDARSHVIGVVQAFYPPMSNMTLATPLEWLRNAYTFARTK